MKRTVTAFAMLGLLAGTALTAQPVLAQDISFRLPWILNVQGAGYVMAKEKGFYEEEGLNVEIMPGGPNLNSTALVASGANTFGSNDVNGVIFGANQGMDLVIVGACFQRHPAGVITLAEANINEPKDLVGKTLAYNEGGPWTLTQAMLAKAGVALTDINLVVSPSTELLINKTVDAKTGFTVNEPIAVELAGLPTKVLLPSDYGVNTYAEAIFTTKAYAEANPEVVRKFLAATRKGYDYAYANQEETVAAVVAINTQLDPVQQAEQLRRQEAYVYTDFTKANGACAFDGAVVSDTMDVMKEFAGLETTLDPATLFTTEYLPQ
ncbi:NitT/TauT family transport system substrate-binding protein [Devosia enhydra]|uniref:Thiamine pyrimidine synthase n=1 Tax=Devosia enhydra TaxID=665118 RepID=A0A1K2I2W3_9HYPH|nr:ABC transporter substrate-binding protein [Devosia enhydra]SFZ86734.1 NitT/TauT family transport system substrate-binding protein [Devosia enhydra]